MSRSPPRPSRPCAPQPGRAAAGAEDAELLLAGITFSRHFTLSAVADGPQFRRALHAAGLAPDGFGLDERLRVDAAFAVQWQMRPTDDAVALEALMVEVLVQCSRRRC